MTITTATMTAQSRSNNEEAEKPQKQRKDYSNWCRTLGHPAECSCIYPKPWDIVPMRGALPGTRPMPKDK